MQSTIEKTFTVDAPVDAVWAFLSDPNRVVTCVPGARITETIDERTYRGAVGMKIGPVVTDFQGDIRIERLDEGLHEIVLAGQGRDAKGKGSADMTMTGRLRVLEPGRTEVTSTMTVSVVGRLAQFGARLFEDIAGRMFDQFTACFTEALRATPALDVPSPEHAAADDAGTDGAADGAGAPAAEMEKRKPEPVKALPLVSQALWATLARSFRRLTGRPAKTE